MTYSRAFSLIELSIVLVILGLLIGAILSGKSLIRASELRSITADISRVRSIVQTFREKYFYLPGDMPNAVRFWGAATGSSSDGVDVACAAYTTAATSSATCNGDGDGALGASTNRFERYRFWQHLANAGMIEGSYTGVQGAGGVSEMSVGVNVYQTKVKNVGIGSLYWGLRSSDSYHFDGDLGNVILVGKNKAAAENSGRFLSPQEAWSVDKKLDDGIPATGGITPFSWGTCTNAASGATVTAAYLTTSEDTGLCSLYLRRAY